MKTLQYLLLSTIFLAGAAMQCDEEDAEDRVYTKLTGIEVSNINNEGRNFVVSDEPIKKEAYVIGIKYLKENSDNYIPIEDTIVSTQVYCNININTDYPAGTDISELFTQFAYGSSAMNTDYLLILRSPVPAGNYRFKVVLSTTNKEFESETNPINLY